MRLTHIFQPTIETHSATHHKAGLSVPRRACLSRGGPVYPEADLLVQENDPPMEVHLLRTLSFSLSQPLTLSLWNDCFATGVPVPTATRLFYKS